MKKPANRFQKNKDNVSFFLYYHAEKIFFTLFIAIIFIIICFGVHSLRTEITTYNNGIHAQDGGQWIYSNTSSNNYNTFYTFKCEKCYALLTLPYELIK